MYRSLSSSQVLICLLLSGLFLPLISAVHPSFSWAMITHCIGQPLLYSGTLVEGRLSLMGQFIGLLWLTLSPFARRDCYSMSSIDGSHLFQREFSKHYANKFHEKNAPAAESKTGPLKKTFLQSVYFPSELGGHSTPAPSADMFYLYIYSFVTLSLIYVC